MQRFVRMNEVQYTDDEQQANALMAQGFIPAPIEGDVQKEQKKKSGEKAADGNG
nr:MAG TPA: hypothetical protein [Caudoviricetes sp.]